MVNLYTHGQDYSNFCNPSARRFQGHSSQPFSPAPQFAGSHSSDAYTAQHQEPAQKKTSLFKKALIGAGLIGGLYFFGKKAASLLTGKAAESIAGKVAKLLPEEGMAKSIGQTLSPENAKAVKEVLKKLGIKPEDVTSFLGSHAGEALLNVAKSERGINTIKSLLLGVAGKYLPESAVQTLEKQATAQNIEKLLDAGILTSVMKYGGDLYRQSSGQFRSFLQTNAEPIAEQLGRLTGFEKASIEKYLKAFQA